MSWKIAVWPDGDWCEEEEIEDKTRLGSGYAKSDDYTIVEVPEEIDDDDVDAWLEGTKPQG